MKKTILPYDKEHEKQARERGRSFYYRSRKQHNEPEWCYDEGSVWSFYNERK